MHQLRQHFHPNPLVIHSEEEMINLGRELADLLQGGDILGLVGDLGAGKTHLVRGILEGLGASNPGVSPTFSLAHEHTDGRLPVVHFDFYRMTSPDEALGIGWDECLSGGHILLVEWADRFDGALMPPETQWLVLTHTGENTREVRYIPAN
ncbi:MAG: tRNA (adenosine(37)-N6)-threonylcarbamoyltransferase complex ATPase subunit type 1 TsaE [Akkermansia sp.]|nr:tRNA (adenosine(37)-N6)-threonylcarbamoyltransferase complex ATPase subunit type 1 TsaE [Akkermansia sp.]